MSLLTLIVVFLNMYVQYSLLEINTDLNVFLRSKMTEENHVN
jgi:hypothetical protein